MISAKVGNLPVVQCNKYGEEVQELTLKEVTLTQAAKFSLFSITNRHKEGWKLQINYNAIWIVRWCLT